ncbi:TonB-dependent receptor domain-containing protein [Sphingopyxis granuli]|uniref:TonB-dependent receptor domain-containing protein n=1 Tax=Sphingopyxis granuli TaxID=267128 RepID=UPI001C3F184E|nr:TonB-dependent receptor [Sphingopyxis granuli]
MRYRDLRGALASSAAICAVAVATPAMAQTRSFDVPAQSAATGIPALAEQADIQILVSEEAVRGKTIRAIKGSMTVDQAVRRAAADAGLRVVSSDGRTWALASAISANAGNAATSASDDGGYAANEIIVTAQKKAESIQNVPISVSAFSAKSLDEQKVEGGSELVRAVPNVSFSKTNFASYNFSIRGVGTKALSVASDPAVAISFNNTPLIRNRLFEQEYFDVERVEVLRGPQGTLYGRNATGGVVNMIPNIADPDKFEGDLQLEAGNYGSMRAKGMLNVPLSDTLAVRVAGAWTSRDGYDFNTVTNRRVNGRDLWSTRTSAAWEPSDSFRVNAIWEHFNENDDRSRTGKQLCTRDPGPTSIGGVDLTNDATIRLNVLARGLLSQGCQDSSLYSDDAFGAPNGFALPNITAAATAIGLGLDPNLDTRTPSGYTLLDPTKDPYASIAQSRNLRHISTTYDPTFRAKNDVFQLNAELSLGPSIKLYSQTSYTRDNYNSTQDYNRFSLGPVIRDSSVAVDAIGNTLPTAGISPGGVFLDPQLGPSDTILGVDQVKSRSSQWYQELRLQSALDGAINFVLGANYLEYKIDEDYYVFNNLFTAAAQGIFAGTQSGYPIRTCENYVSDFFDPCVYVDPNPLSQINGDGHNYFRSRNINKTRSKAVFGEVYWNLSDNLKLTTGLRLTEDKKVATPINTQLLLGGGIISSGFVNFGYRVSPDIKQKWTRLTGRMVLDWKPNISFTDSTLVYASYARGYKGGGANPPGIDGNPELLQFFPLPTTFRPESVNAFEIGMKNSFGGGKFTLNANAFLYDYTDYQVSQIVDRLALNENYDAKMWGAELELAWRPTSRFRANANFGYLGTRIDNGMKSIDVMNRTQDNPDWVLVKSWLQLASNCVAPKALVEQVINNSLSVDYPALGLLPLCGGSWYGDYREGSLNSILYGFTYDPATDAPNQGRGFDADLGGNELPNAPHWTVNLGAQYTLPINDWDITLRGDYYRQAKSWARVYNTEIDRLKSWDNANVSLTVERPDSGLAFQFYIKNLFNKTPITDAFLNSDDSGLTANVFTLDPRIIGFSIAKKF